MTDNPNNDVKCEYCSSSETGLAQLRKNENGVKQIYKCRKCNRKFTPDDGFKRFRHNPVMIKTALKLLNQGVSLSRTAYYLNQSFRINVSRKTLLDWKRRFDEM